MANVYCGCLTCGMAVEQYGERALQWSVYTQRTAGRHCAINGRYQPNRNWFATHAEHPGTVDIFGIIFVLMRLVLRSRAKCRRRSAGGMAHEPRWRQRWGH